MTKPSIPATCLALASLAGACCARGQDSSIANINLNAGRAYANIKHLVGFGPRPAGSPSLENARRWIKTELREAGCQVEEDRFTAATPLGAIPMVNVIGEIPGQESKVVVLAAHYETKRFATFPFVGANDSASGVGLVLELARALANRKNRFTYWLVFFDGEEAIQNWSPTDGLYGSRHMVQKLTSTGELGRIHALILLDMIGDAQLNILRDQNSTPWLNNLVWDTAKQLGYEEHFTDQRTEIGDDHYPFIQAGVSAMVIIDFDYGPGHRYWHSAEDTVDKLSPRSLAIVGSVVLASLRGMETQEAD